jgi:hypothetical protein
MMVITLIAIIIVVIIKQIMDWKREERGKILCNIYGRKYFTHTKPCWSMHIYFGEY